MKLFSTSFFKVQKLVLGLCFCFPFAVNAQILLSQDFNAGTGFSNYVGTGANQFDTIMVSAPSMSNSVYVSGNRVTMQKYSGAGIITKSTNLSPTSPTFLKIKFKISVPFNTPITAANSAAVIYVGSSGFLKSNSTTGEVRHSSILVGFGSNKTFYFRNSQVNPFANSDSLTEESQITWFINNSGATQNYANPSGGASSLDDDKWDLWVGNNRIFSGVNASGPTATLDNFKVLFNGANSHGGISFDDIEISTGAEALPVAFANINAVAQGAANIINWETATEINNKGFYVQRRSETGAWINLGFVAGNNRASTYSFVDNSPLTNSYYRLQQVDIDGKQTYSSVVSVSKNSIETFSVAPNPTSSKLIVNIKTAATFFNATLYDFMGKKVLTQNGRTGIFELDVSRLPKGSYILSVQAENNVFNKKIIVQ